MTATSPTIGEYQASSTKVVGAASGVDYAYRDVGEGTPPLVLLQHFRGNLDNWDPALIDALAATRRVGNKREPRGRADVRQRRRGQLDEDDAKHDPADGS